MTGFKRLSGTGCDMVTGWRPVLINRSQQAEGSKTLFGLHVDKKGDRYSAGKNRLWTSSAVASPTAKWRAATTSRSSKGTRGCFVFFVISSPLFPCSEQVWQSTRCLSGRRTVFRTETSGSMGKGRALAKQHIIRFKSHPDTWTKRATWGIFPLRVQNPLPVKFCSRCPVSFP